jgi:hypothetical protein
LEEGIRIRSKTWPGPFWVDSIFVFEYDEPANQNVAAMDFKYKIRLGNPLV